MLGLLERAKQFAKDATSYISSIVGNDNEVKPAQKKEEKKPNAVIKVDEKKITKPIDTFEQQESVKTNNTKTSTRNNKITKKDVLQKGKDIDKLKNQYNISDEEFYEIILPKVGYSKKEFLKLNPEKQMKVLNTIYAGTNLYIFDKYKNDPNFNRAEILGNAVADLKKAQDMGGVKDAKEFDKQTRHYIHKLNKEIKSATTDEEKIGIITRNRTELENTINTARKAELQKCKTDEERAIVNAKYDAKIESFEGYLQTNYIVEHCEPEKAYISTYLRRGKDMANGYERAIKSFSCNAMSSAADSFTHERRIKQLESYYNQGDQISADVYGQATEIQAQYMSQEGLKKLEEEAYKFKKEFYNNKEKYKFLTEEHLTKESSATALGTILNKNLTAEQKAEFLKIWNSHAKEFSDYDEVRNELYIAIKEYLNKHPEAKQGIEDIKTKYQQKTERNFEVPYSAKKRYDNRFNEKKNSQVLPKDSKPQTNKATRQQLEQALISKPFEEVRKEYTKNSDRDFAEVVLHNPKLKGYKQHIVGYIKTLSAEDLSNIIQGCSTDMFLFVLRNITPDKAGHLYDLSKGEKCYSARKLGEKIIEEGNKNAAA